MMSDPEGHNRSITAPAALGLETREAFREEAMLQLEALADGGTLHVDLGGTKRVDSAGLSVLLGLQRRAAERQQRIVLHRPSDEFRFLLALTEISDLFEVTR